MCVGSIAGRFSWQCLHLGRAFYSRYMWIQPLLDAFPYRLRFETDVASGKLRELPCCDASWDECAPKIERHQWDEMTVDVYLSRFNITFVCTVVASPHSFIAARLSVPGLAIHSISPSVIDLWFSIGSVSRLGRIQFLHHLWAQNGICLRFLMFFAISTMVWSLVFRDSFPSEVSKKHGTQMVMKRPNSWLLWGSAPCSLAPSVCNTHGQRFPGFEEAHNFNINKVLLDVQRFDPTTVQPRKPFLGSSIFEFWPIWIF